MPQSATFYLLLETSRAFTREIFRGVTRWSNLYGPVTFVVSTGHVDQELPKMRETTNAGVIARLPTPGVLDAVRNLGLPIVTIEPSLPEYDKIKEELGVSEIISDAEKIARLAFDHFYSRGFRRFAFCGLPRRIWSKKRERFFTAAAQREGLSCLIYDYPPMDDNAPLLSRAQERAHLVRWLLSLPKPVGVLACNDDRAAELLEICRFEEIEVPDRVAVLGVDNDDLLCELTSPPLSSVAFNLDEAGFRAAKLLWNLISGTTAGYHRIPLIPIGIVTRRSTDALAEEDPLVRAAIRFIRENYQRKIGVAEVARELDVSRRTLERRFAETVKRSVSEQIEFFRFEQARHLLTETEDRIEQIAEISGFSHLKPMVRVFREKLGQTPAEVRKNHPTEPPDD